MSTFFYFMSYFFEKEIIRNTFDVYVFVLFRVFLRKTCKNACVENVRNSFERSNE